MEVYVLIIVGVLFAILIRLSRGGVDRQRIEQYIEERGGKVIEAAWTPFGPGWLGKNHDRIYDVRYLDKDGHEHRAYCRTSGWSGVYFTQDTVEKRAATGSALEKENRQLREELARLKRQQGE